MQMTSWLAPVLALAGVLVGALFAPLAATRFGWQTSRREAFDRAISAVRVAQLAAKYPRTVNLVEIGDTDEARAYLRELPVKGFEYYRQAIQEMRSALAALEPYLIPEWDDDQWQTRDATYITLLIQLKQARRKTLIFYWGSERRVER
ncbi:hypothetical protein [Streptomyces sp. NBC_00338]|uniref:hypothetical protein n=1 Tax=Streptomyces sp. NBC_00338 TaxID=2975715 RepID=UPI002252912C|nr:hypothetical protein [Streptomyces sp. NBC_00338]MCX5140020.1 hypothetical protein [Streptomyces sp. NBC_00338]